ncbi:unnamed protein product, partial [Larinioides sclopetarius]
MLNLIWKKSMKWTMKPKRIMKNRKRRIQRKLLLCLSTLQKHQKWSFQVSLVGQKMGKEKLLFCWMMTTP